MNALMAQSGLLAGSASPGMLARICSTKRLSDVKSRSARLSWRARLEPICEASLMCWLPPPEGRGSQARRVGWVEWDGLNEVKPIAECGASWRRVFLTAKPILWAEWASGGNLAWYLRFTVFRSTFLP